jgi:hypothetical protein
MASAVVIIVLIGLLLRARSYATDSTTYSVLWVLPGEESVTHSCRLLALNHARYEEEERLGLHKKKGKATARKGRKAGRAEALSLFGVAAGG